MIGWWIVNSGEMGFVFLACLELAFCMVVSSLEYRRAGRPVDCLNSLRYEVKGDLAKAMWLGVRGL